MSARLTSDYARRILAEQLGGERDAGVDAARGEILSGPVERVELLPIREEHVSEPPPPRDSRPSRSSRPSAPRQSQPETVPAAEPVRLRRSEVAVYALAALVVATSIIAMALLMRP